MKVILTMKSTLLVSAWHGWLDYLVHHKNNFNTGLKVVHRMRNMSLGKAWNRWQNITKLQIQLRSSLFEQAKNFRRRCLNQAMLFWMSECNRMSASSVIFRRWESIGRSLLFAKFLALFCKALWPHPIQAPWHLQKCYLNQQGKCNLHRIRRAFEFWLIQKQQSSMVFNFSVRPWHYKIYFEFTHQMMMCRLIRTILTWAAFRKKKAEILQSSLRASFLRDRQALKECVLKLSIHAHGSKRRLKFKSIIFAKATLDFMKLAFRFWAGSGHILAKRKEAVDFTLRRLNFRGVAHSFDTFRANVHVIKSLRQITICANERCMATVITAWRKSVLPKALEKRIGKVLLNFAIADARIRSMESVMWTSPKPWLLIIIFWYPFLWLQFCS